MMIPGWPPLTPESHESLARTIFPWLLVSNESSPMYQTLPHLSWA